MSDRNLIKTLGQYGEFELIRLLTRGLSLPPGVIGPGDDCAVVPLSQLKGQYLSITTDAMVENRHFRRNYASAIETGRKLISVTVSDLAGMGALPLLLVVNAQLPTSLEKAWLDEFYKGVRAEIEDLGVFLAGGNLTSADELSFCATAIGVSESEPVKRSGAMEGDDIWVSGIIGSSGLGLAILAGEIDGAHFSDKGATAIASYRRPTSRVALGAKLAALKLASAMIDVSDGLIQDAQHIASMSRNNLVIDFDRVPYDSTITLTRELQARSVTAGGDYELLFTSPRSARGRVEQLGADLVLKISRIGEVKRISSGQGMVFLREREGEAVSADSYLLGLGIKGPLGCDHFRS